MVKERILCIQIFLYLFVFINIPAIAQKDYSRLDGMISHWLEENSNTILAEKENTAKVIYYKSFDYQVEGTIKKGILQPGTFVEIQDNKNNDTILGKVKLLDGNTYVLGKRSSSYGQTYGTFKVSNTKYGVFTSKKNLAKDLLIEDVDVLYHKGYYNDCPAILSMVDKPYVAIDGVNGGRSYKGFSADVSSEELNRIGYKNFTDLLMTVNENATLELDNGHTFKGRVSPVLTENGYIHFRLREGVQQNIPNGPLSISVEREGDNLKMKTIYRYPQGNIKEETLIIKSSSMPKNSYWNKMLYYDNISEVVFVYTDNDRYTGKCEFSIEDMSDGKQKIISTITNGTYVWANGDVFIGNFSGTRFFGIPVEGQTVFCDGTVKEGNWLKQYNLAETQYESLSAIRYPTEIRAEANKLVFSNKYAVYGGSWVSYFHPDHECTRICTLHKYLIYDKKNHWYICSENKEIKENDIYLEFQTDARGNHTKEIIYEGHKPLYINILEWHSNGELKSIKSYHYNTKQILLSINFFSDGSLKNAYKYGIGNLGQNILRMSKESHPTLGGFTTKLFDLDGNYERTMRWDIGEEINFFGDNKTLAPSRLEVDKLNSIVD